MQALENLINTITSRCILSTIAMLALLLFLVAPVQAQEQGQLTAEIDELSLYLGADQLVEVATRSPKPMSQVAENVTIITAREIEAMNAHTVAEVLNRMSGIIVDGNYTDFGSGSTIFIHGSDYEHVLVLLDGIRWGYVSYDYPETNTIPVQIIKRIEVIKGAASSTWGSSLGGVVNIITKDTGTDMKPTGSLSGTYGESNSTDLRGDAAGRLGRLGYYLYAGYQDSDGIRNNRFFESQSFYGKFQLDLPQDIDFGVTFGHSRPDYVFWSVPAWDYEWLINDHVSFATAFFSVPLGDAFNVNFSGYWYEDTLSNTGQVISTVNLDYNDEYEGKTIGGSARLVWNGLKQTLVLGTEIERRKNTDSDIFRSYTAPSDVEELWAILINDTIRFWRLTLIPGLRYDHLSITDDEISPSFGLTYQVSDTTLLRANASRGFRKPYVSILTGDPSFHPVNPDLESETIWSYQAGIETAAIPFLRVKVTLFDHEVEGRWRNFENSDDFTRQGAELEIETGSFYNFSLAANGSVIKMKPENSDSGTHYLANVLLKYDDNTWRGQIFGHNVWPGDVSPPSVYDDETGTFIWDLVVGRIVHLNQFTTAEFFAELHNITDEDQSFDLEAFPNAGRWVEAGVRFNY